MVKRGFTLVELLIAIVVIAILAGLTLVVYSGIQERALKSVMADTLRQAGTATDVVKLDTQKYPNSVPDTVRPSPKIKLSMSSTSQYKNLDPSQNAVLFYNQCGELVAEGYGKGTNKGGSVEQYVSACNVYNKDELQVNNAWQSQNLKTPVDDNKLPSIALASESAGDSWRPDMGNILSTFYTTWHERFLDQGGTYPVTVFWDNWASPSNGGVIKPSLPTPSTGGGWTASDAYCIQATAVKNDALKMYIQNDGAPTDGACPTKP